MRSVGGVKQGVRGQGQGQKEGVWTRNAHTWSHSVHTWEAVRLSGATSSHHALGSIGAYLCEQMVWKKGVDKG